MAELCTLQELLIGREPDELKVPLQATLDGQPVTVHTVLQRTAVYEISSWSGKQLARRESFMVDPAAIRWREIQVNQAQEAGRRGRRRAAQNRRSVTTGWNNSLRKPTAEQSAAARQASDERARQGG